jgi:hypothetical protein
MIMKQRTSKVRERMTSEIRGIGRERVDVVWEDMQREGERSVKSAIFSKLFEHFSSWDKRVCAGGKGGRRRKNTHKSRQGEKTVLCL